MIGDNFRDRHWPQWPEPMTPFNPEPRRSAPDIDPVVKLLTGQAITRKEFDDLKAEVKAIRELLEKANAYDKLTDQPDCETAAKVDLLRKVGEALGIDLESVLNPS